MKTNAKLFHVIVDLGKAADLTLGGGGGGYETKNRPFGLLHRTEKPETNTHIAYIVDLGAVTSLTLGGYGKFWEWSRANAEQK